MLLALGHGAATSAPITADAAPGQVPSASPWIRLSEHELVSTGGGALSQPDAFTQSDRFQPREGGRFATDLRSWNASDNPILLDPRDAPGGGSTLDTLRAFVNVGQGAGSASRRSYAGAPKNPRDDPLARIDFGPEARQWAQNAFKEIVDSVVQLDVSERGRASFSILGIGDLGVSVSGDRSQVALTRGDDVLLSAQRSQPAAVGPGSAQPHTGSSAWSGVPHDTTPLKKAIELVLEIAGHPLSMLVYLLVAAYALLWSVLSRRPRSRAHRGARRAAVKTDAAAPARRTRRRRHRVRRHRLA